MITKNTTFYFLALLSAMLYTANSHANQSHILADFALDELKKSANLVGLASASYTPQGEQWSRYIGYADKSAQLGVTADTEFRLASVSKFVTTGLLAKLVGEGKIDLDKSIYTYIPNFPAKQHDFTIRQLVTHTAGIPHYQSLLDHAINHNPAPYKHVAQGVSLFQHRPLLHKPGSDYRYSSFGFNLLSLALENAGKQPFLNQLAELTTQANSPSINAERIEYPSANWSKLYDAQGREQRRGNIGYKWAGGGLVSTAPDLAKFGIALLNKSIIAPTTLAQFNTRQAFANGENITVSRSNMAVGWRIKENNLGQPQFHHSGSMPGARSHISVFPSSQQSIVLLSNTRWTVALDQTAASLQMLLNSQAQQKCPATDNYLFGAPNGVTLNFHQQPNMCVTRISFDPTLTNKLAGQTNSSSFTLLTTAANNVALITPIGIFQGTYNGKTLNLDILATRYQYTDDEPKT